MLQNILKISTKYSKYLDQHFPVGTNFAFQSIKNYFTINFCPKHLNTVFCLLDKTKQNQKKNLTHHAGDISRPFGRNRYKVGRGGVRAHYITANGR